MFSPFVKSGLGLHTGLHSEVLVEMGLPGTGTVFIVDDIEIPAVPGSVSTSQRRATALVGQGRSVSTIEHLTAALAAFGETDVRIFVDGNEIPILDGSALPWAVALRENGAEPGPCFVEISKEIHVEMDGSTAHLKPLEKEKRPVIRVAVEFEHAGFGRQEVSFHPNEDDFQEAIAPARTFAFESEVAEIRGSGLAQGGSLECAVVIGQSGPLNPEGLRFKDEPARHKLLDAVGDMALLGGLPWAEVVLEKPGHRLMRELTSKAFDCLVPKGETPRETESDDG